MRRITCLVAILILCLAYSAGADEKKAKAADSPLLFINTYSNYSTFIAPNGNYQKFAEMAEDAGFRLGHGMQAEIYPENLEGVSVYMMPAPLMQMGDISKTNMRSFLKGGGTLFIIGYDPQDVDYLNWNSFLGDYGLTFGEWDSSKQTATVLSDSPLSKPEKCTTLQSQQCVSIEIAGNKGIPVAQLESGLYLGAISKSKNLKKGRLFVFGDILIFGDPNAGGVLYKEDNEAFVKNILNYLKGGYDLAAVVSKVKGRKVVVAGKKMNVVAKIKNMGSLASDKVKLGFFLSDDGNYPVSPATNTLLKKVNVVPVEAGAAMLVKAKARVPAGTAAGDYYLIAVVDPDGTSSDTDASNNFKVSKKKITVE